MNKIELSEGAKADIRDIVSYTQKKYGEQQARKYVALLHHHMELLADMPHLGHSRSDIPIDYKAEVAGKHIIVFTKRAETIFIARILHSSMDFPRHLT
jgi:toxin ParE1/3/4